MQTRRAGQRQVPGIAVHGSASGQDETGNEIKSAPIKTVGGTKNSCRVTPVPRDVANSFTTLGSRTGLSITKTHGSFPGPPSVSAFGEEYPPQNPCTDPGLSLPQRPS